MKMPPRFYTHGTRARIRLNQPNQLFHFIHWQAWTWGPSLFLFLIGCFPTQTRWAFVASQVISFLSATLLDLPRNLSERSAKFVEELDPRTLRRAKTLGLLTVAWVAESAFVYYVSAWSRTGFVWALSVVSILCTVAMIVSVQVLMSVLIQYMSHIAWRTVFLWCALGLFETWIVYCGARCTMSNVGCRELFLSLVPFLAKAAFVWSSGIIAACRRRASHESQMGPHHISVQPLYWRASPACS